MLFGYKHKPLNLLIIETRLVLFAIHLLHNLCNMEMSIHRMLHDETDYIGLIQLLVLCRIILTSPAIQTLHT